MSYIKNLDSYMDEMLKTMLEIAKDSSIDPEWRVLAGRTIDGVNDTLIKRDLLDEVANKAIDGNDRQSDKLIDQIKKINKDKRQPWENDDDDED